ncbi:MAG: TetR/AcrR family transcriptional regulator C-terminal domain-containing protein [Oscillospiraceae bacterium]|nr:TetR/AcrR family transcriptional regulator C-terminal domain-containing protein [Oscillospiraceae bacterium]
MSRYTETLIMRAFSEMLDEMPLDKITVSALTRRSDISHNTFYYHYNDIYDLLEVWIRMEIAPYLDRDGEYPDWESGIAAMLKAWKRDERRIYHVFHSLSREQMERHVFEQTEYFFHDLVRSLPDAGDSLPEPQLQRISEFACYIFLGFLMRFLWNKMRGDIDQSVHELSVLLSSFLHHAIADARSGKL